MKKATARFALATALFSACALAGLTPAKAATVSWNLSSPAGEQLTTETFSSGGFSLGAAGYTFSGAITSVAFTAVDLFNKFTSGDATETGLGLGNNAAGNKVDTTGDHEIVANSLVRIDTTAARLAGLGNFRFTMGSSTNGEGWDVYGSTAANTGLVALFTDGTDQGTTHFLSDAYKFFYFTYDGGVVQSGQGDNVLLTSFAGDSTGGGGSNPTPLPAALPLFAGGLGVMGLLARRRKRKNTAALAAA
jgi:hypothetical protein